MKIFSSWTSQPLRSHFTLRADNVLSNSGKEHYQPDWIEALEAMPMLLVRIEKVAKCVERSFAHTYFGHVSLGVSLRAKAIDDGLPQSMKEDFDSSLIRWSQWLPYQAIAEQHYWGHKMLTPHSVEERISLACPTIELISDTITELSRYYLLKMGDLIALPLTDNIWSLERGNAVFICDDLENELIYFRIR